MTKSATFKVTVSRINESMKDAPYEELNAIGLELEPDGTLSIKCETGGRSFSSGLWDGFEVKRLHT